MTAAPPHRIEIVPWGFWKAGTNVNRQQNSGYLGGGRIYNSPTANGDYVEWEVLLAAGTWACDVIYVKDTSRGIIDYSLDGVEFGSHDQYAAVAANSVTTFSGITVAADGNYTLRATVDGKHASSSNYLYSLQLITLRRTGA